MNELTSRWSGTGARDDALPRLRFPDVPPEPLASAIPHDLQPRHWNRFLDGRSVPAGARVLDFGCGKTNRREWAARYGMEWWGLDIPDSQEALAREDRQRVVLYDGRNIPIADGSFFALLSSQVFEHVPDPPHTFAEIARILQPGGYLLGSTSHNEPFHSRSTYGYSALWLSKLFVSAGFDLVTMAPGIDALSLAVRRLARQARMDEDVKRFGDFFEQASPLNQIIDAAGTREKVDPVRINALKLELCGHVHFLARKRA
jgi:SAM-dependent methyltransferase